MSVIKRIQPINLQKLQYMIYRIEHMLQLQFTVKFCSRFISATMIESVCNVSLIPQLPNSAIYYSKTEILVIDNLQLALPG